MIEHAYCRWCGKLGEFSVQLTLDGGYERIGPTCTVSNGKPQMPRCEPVRQISHIDLTQGRKRFATGRGRR